MSAAHDAHADASAGHHDAHDHFDNEPVTELGADEPRTPNWVPYLGLALFFSAGVACLMCGDDAKPGEDKPAAVAAAPAEPPVAQQPPKIAPAPPGRPAIPVPGQPGQPGAGTMPNGLPKLTPEQARELQKQMESIQALHNKRPDGAPPPPPPGGAAPPVPVPRPLPQGNPAVQ